MDMVLMSEPYFTTVPAYQGAMSSKQDLLFDQKGLQYDSPSFR